MSSRYRAGTKPKTGDEANIDDERDQNGFLKPVKKERKGDAAIDAQKSSNNSTPVDRRLLRATKVDTEEGMSDRRKRAQMRHEVAEVLAEGVDDDEQTNDNDESLVEDMQIDAEETTNEDAASVDDENDRRRERLRKKNN